MRDSRKRHLRAGQRGSILLAMVGMVSLMVIYAYVSGLTRSTANLAQRETLATTTALAQAKEALIAYAVTYKDRNDDPGGGTYTVPGYLPCPELVETASNEGVAAGTCGSALVSQLGRLPWRTLGLDPLKDGSGECLWYAVSGKYKNNPNGVSGSTTTSNMMNWDNNGQFKVYDADGSTLLTGSSEDNQAVAVIFAPGRALSGQVRTVAAGSSACRGSYSAAAYLETANGINNSVVSGTASAVSSYIAGTESSTFNDKLVYITRADIWTAIKKRTDFNNYLRALTRRAAECTAMYGQQNNKGYPDDKRLPWASDVSLSGTSLPTYAVNARYNDNSGTGAGRLSFRVDTSDSKTNNNISNSISDYGTNSAYIFTNGSYCSYTADQKIWYDHWKDHLFYAVAKRYDPNANDSPMLPCTGSTCLTINGAGSYTAVVIFAGEKLSGTSRNTAANKGSVANYLSATNSTAILADDGAGNYQAAAMSSTFNDIVYAIDTTLAVKCYNGTAMVSVPAAAVAPPGSPAAYAACP